MERNGIFPTLELDSSKVQPMYRLQLHAWTQNIIVLSFSQILSITQDSIHTLIHHHLQNPKSRKDTSNCNVILFSKEATNSDQVIYYLYSRSNTMLLQRCRVMEKIIFWLHGDGFLLKHYRMIWLIERRQIAQRRRR